MDTPARTATTFPGGVGAADIPPTRWRGSGAAKALGWLRGLHSVANRNQKLAPNAPPARLLLDPVKFAFDDLRRPPAGPVRELQRIISQNRLQKGGMCAITGLGAKPAGRSLSTSDLAKLANGAPGGCFGGAGRGRGGLQAGRASRTGLYPEPGPTAPNAIAACRCHGSSGRSGSRAAAQPQAAKVRRLGRAPPSWFGAAGPGFGLNSGSTGVQAAAGGPQIGRAHV